MRIRPLAIGENWESLHPELFPSTASPATKYDIDSLLGEVLAHVNVANVEKMVVRTSFSMASHRIFDAVQGGFGRHLKTRCGEASFLRVRSFLNQSCATVDAGRATMPMAPGEIREIVVVTLDQDSYMRDGSIATLRCTCVPTPMLESAAVAATPTPAELAPSSIYGLSMLPILLVDRHVKKPKKADLTFKGFPILLFASIDVTVEAKIASNGVPVPSKSALMRAPSIMAFTEWILGVDAPSRYPMSTCMISRMSIKEYEFEHAKLCAKMNAHFQRERDHPTVDDLGEQTAIDCDPAKKVAAILSECTTLGFVLDLQASATFESAHLPFFSDPCGFPLYASICVVLAATPSLIQHWVPNNDAFNEETRSVAKVFDAFKATTPGTTTLLETLVQLALEQMAAPSGRQQHQANKPLSSEHMRRQGVTICHELCTRLHEDVVDHFSAVDASFCGDEAVREARATLVPAFLSERSKIDARAFDVRGSTRQQRTEGSRCASRTARLRHLLQTMIDVNEVLQTGIFRMRREYEANEGEAAVRHSPSSSGASGSAEERVMLNVEAWNTATAAATAYLVQGPFALLEGRGFACFPLRHRTRAKCGACKAPFRFEETIGRSRLSHCPTCHAYYCGECYSAKVAEVRSRTGLESVSSEQVVSNRDVLFCSACAKRKQQQGPCSSDALPKA